MKRYKIPQMLEIMGSEGVPYQRECQTLYDDNLKEFQTEPGSTNNHQAWIGGYHDHVAEVMNIALLIHPPLASTGREVPPLPWALLGLYLHDLEKPWAYEMQDDMSFVRREEFKDHDFANMFRRKKAEQYGIVLSDEMWNDIKHVEGDLDEYSNAYRASSPLAAFMHMCDGGSARMWHDHPLAQNEPWGSRILF